MQSGSERVDDIADAIIDKRVAGLFSASGESAQMPGAERRAQHEIGVAIGGVPTEQALIGHFDHPREERPIGSVYMSFQRTRQFRISLADRDPGQGKLSGSEYETYDLRHARYKGITSALPILEWRENRVGVLLSKHSKKNRRLVRIDFVERFLGDVRSVGDALHGCANITVFKKQPFCAAPDLSDPVIGAEHDGPPRLPASASY